MGAVLRTLVRWSLRALLGLAAVAVVTLAVVYGLLRSGLLTDSLDTIISRLVQLDDGFYVRVEDVSGDPPEVLRARKVELGDRDGVWLTVYDVDLVWHPFDLFHPFDRDPIRIHVDKAHAPRVVWTRLEAEPLVEDDDPFRWEKFVRLLVGELQVDDFELGPGILRGGQARFRVTGNGVLGEWEHGRLLLDLERIGDGSGGAHVELTTGGSPLEVNGTLTAKEGPGGALAWLAGVPEAGAVTLRVEGSGPLRDWKAHVDLGASALGTLVGDAKLTFGDRGTFEVQASVDPVNALRDSTLVGPGPPLALAVVGSLTPDVELHLQRATVVTQGRALSMDGHLDLVTDAFEASAQLRSAQDDDARVELTAFGLTGANLQLRGVLADGGTLDGKLRVSGLASGEWGADSLEATLKADDPQGGAPATYSFVAQAEGLSLADGPMPLFGDAAQLTMSGKADLEDGILSADPLRLAGGTVVVQGPFAFGGAWQTLDVSLQADAAELGTLAALLETTVAGSASLQLQGRAEHGFETLKMKLSAEASDVKVGESGWNALLEGRSTVEASMDGALQGPLRASLEVKTAGIEGRADAAMEAGGQALVADATLVLDNLARLAEPTRAAIAGRLEVTASARGSLDLFDGRLSLVGDRFSWENARFDSLQTQIDAQGLPEHWSADVQTRAKYGSAEASLDAKVAMPEAGRVVVSDLQLRGPKTTGRAAMDVTLEPLTAIGNVELNSGDLSAWAAMTGISMRGAVEASTLFAVPPGESAAQQVGGSVTLRDLVVGLGDTELRVDAAEVKADSLEIGSRPRGRTSVHVSGGRYGSARLVDGLFSAAGDGTRWSLDTTLHVVDAEALRLSANASYQPGPTSRLTIERAEAEVAKIPIVLLKPATLTLSPGDTNRWSLDSLSMTVAERGRVQVVASTGNDVVHLEARTTDLPLSLLSVLQARIDLLGHLDASVKLDGSSLQTVVGEVEVVGHDVTTEELQASEVAPVSVKAVAQIRGGRAVGTVALEGFSQTDLALAVDAPLEPADNAPVLVDLRWKGEMGELLALLPIGEDKIAGRVDTQLRLSGSIGTPRLTGRLLLEEGTWENSASGLALHNLRAEVQGRGAALDVVQLTATDGAKGTFQAKGRVFFEKLPGFEASLDLKATDAILAKLDVVTARADADIAIRLTRVPEPFAPVDGTITGAVNVKEAQVQIPRRFSSDIPQLEVIEVGLPVDPAAANRRTGSSNITLDVAVLADGRVYVDGRGLQSEWSSDLHVHGRIGDPRLEGTVTSIRGDLGLLGRRFEVTSATVRFDGSKGNVPFLSLKATAEAHDITAIAVVTGNALNPNLELRSEPALPRDEVLSRVLFGQSAANLTPMQSVQLARSVSELAGGPFGGGGPGILSGIGETLGFDRLDVGGDDEGAALSASKYLTDSVYLRVQGGLTPESSKVSLEWKVLPHITVESDVSQDAQGEVGVFWRWDY